MTCQHSDLIIFEDDRTLNLAHIVTTEWYLPPARRGKPAPARELMITTSIPYRDEHGVEGPYLIFVAEGAEELWKLIQSHARPQLPPVTLAPELLEDDEPPVGTTYRAGPAEVFVDSRDPQAEPEVYGPWAGAVSLARFLEAARAVEAIISDPRFLDTSRRPPSPVPPTEH